MVFTAGLAGSLGGIVTTKAEWQSLRNYGSIDAMTSRSKTDTTALGKAFPPAKLADWMALCQQTLKTSDSADPLSHKTADGLDVKALYTANDVPSETPFEGVGLNADGGRSYGWDIRQLHVIGDVPTLTDHILEDIKGGVGSVCLQVAASGQTGVDVTRLADVLAAIDKSTIGVALQAGDQFVDAARALTTWWQKGGFAGDKINGAFNADPLGALAAAGGLDGPLGDKLVALSSLMEASFDWPNVTIAIGDGRPYHAAGASPALELAAAIATLVDYLRACEASGLAPDIVLGKIAIGLAADTDQFMTIAKFRAARRLVWRIGEAAGLAPQRRRIRLTATTSWRMLSRLDPASNILRSTIAASGAAIGGAHSITVLPHTLALGIPDSQARRIARNTQHVLMQEAHIARVNDPSAGAWFVESLTDDLAREAWANFQDIERQGGMAAALRASFVQDRVSEAQSARLNEIRCGNSLLTGSSAFPDLDEGHDSVTPWPENISPPGQHEPVTPLSFIRDSEPFERLRARSDAQRNESGKRPSVFVACLGDDAGSDLRAAWVRGFLQVAGIEPVGDHHRLTASGETGLAFAKTGTTVAVVAGSDDTYALLGEATATALKSAGAVSIYVVGETQNISNELVAAGIDGSLYPKMDLVGGLETLLDRLAEEGVSQ